MASSAKQTKVVRKRKKLRAQQLRSKKTRSKLRKLAAKGMLVGK